MKQFLVSFFLFTGLTGFGQMDFTRENDTLKFVKVNGKVGLVHRVSGKQILEPTYTDLKIEPLGIRFFDGELQGYLPNGANQFIPANYTEITQVYNYFGARTENGTIDLYRGTARIADGLDQVPSETDVLLESDLVIIRKEEKSGIIDQRGAIVIPLEYYVLERFPSFSYEMKSGMFVDYLLTMDRADYFYSPESEGFLRLGAPEIYLAQADGTFVSDSAFTEVSAVNIEKEEIPLKGSGKMAVLNNLLQITYSPYEWVNEFMEWKFCYTGKEYLIFNRFNNVVDRFDDVMIPNKLSPITDEAGIEMTYYTETLFEDFVYVTKLFGEDTRTAIYDLKNEKVVSGWESAITFVSKGINPSGSIVWIYKDETDKLAYSISTAGKSSAFAYEDIVHVSNRFYAFKKEGETTYALCELLGDSVFAERTRIEKSFGSLNYVGINTLSIPEYDRELSRGYADDFGNYYAYQSQTTEGVPAFRTPFTLFKNANGKLGFISWNGKVIDLNADTLFQNDLFTTMIEYRTGNLWGAAEIVWGSVFKADRPAPGFFYLLPDLALIYRLGDDEKHYVDFKGRVFYSVNPERVIVKKGRYKGSEMYADFEGMDNKQDVVIPYRYSEILQTWNEVNFLAKGPDKKWGVISSFADTLLPFKYDDLGFGANKENYISIEFPYRDYDEQCLTRIGGFHGILSLNLRKEIPAIYNRVTYVPDAAFIVEKNGKFGVYDYNLDEKITPVLDEAFIASSVSGKYFLRARKGNHWYNMEFFEGKVPDQTTFLQAPAFDLVINETGFVKTATGYEARDFNNTLLQKEAVMSDYLDENQFRFKDGKIFLIDLNGKVLYPEGLTHLVILEDGRVISVENGVTYSYTTWKKSKTVFRE